MEHGGEPPTVSRKGTVDLSLSTNPYGPPPYLTLAIRRGRREIAAYPDRGQSELTERLQDDLGVDAGEVLLAGSASELLRISIASFGQGRRVLLAPHTYGEYRRIALSVGSNVVLGPMPDLIVDAGTWAEAVPARGLVVLANPATPTGQYISPRELGPLVRATERRAALLLVDESYLPFVRGARSVAGTSENLLTVFSWSKVLGTPGLPLGHAVGARTVIRALRAHLLPWSVGPFARQLGLLALEHPSWARASLARVERTARDVRQRLRSASKTHYFMVRSRSGSALTQTLGRRGFRVRDLASIGLPEHIRFAVRGEPETCAFLAVLAQEIGQDRFGRRPREPTEPRGSRGVVGAKP